SDTSNRSASWNILTRVAGSPVKDAAALTWVSNWAFFQLWRPSPSHTLSMLYGSRKSNPYETMPNWICGGLAFIASVKVLFSLLDTSTWMPRFWVMEAAIAAATDWRTGASLR